MGDNLVSSGSRHASRVIGSQQSSARRLQQQPLRWPERTRCAACPYFSRTISLTSVGEATMVSFP
jgi:hypothetical protein